MSPMKLEELTKRVESLQNSANSYGKRGNNSASKRMTPDKTKVNLAEKKYGDEPRYIRPPTPDEQIEFSSPRILPQDEVLPKFDDFQAILQSAKEINKNDDKDDEEDVSPNIKPRRYDIEYKSIQDTLKSIKQMRHSPELTYKSNNMRQSQNELDFDYSITSENFSRADENEDVLASTDKFKYVFM